MGVYLYDLKQCKYLFYIYFVLFIYIGETQKPQLWINTAIIIYIANYELIFGRIIDHIILNITYIASFNFSSVDFCQP